MGRLTDDLAQLRQTIDNQRESRQKDNAERSAQEYVRATSVNTMIAGFAANRTEQAKIDAHALNDFVTVNTRSVVDLLDQFSSDHQAKSSEGRENRASFVADVAKKTADLMAEFDANHKDTSEKAAKERADFIADLGHEVASLLDNFNTTRVSQANEAAQERSEFFSDLASSISRFLSETQTNRSNDAKISSEDRNSFVSSLAEQVSSQVDAFNQARAEMAKSTSEERASFVSNLASGVASLINEVATDRAGANAAFFGKAVKSEKKNEIPNVSTHSSGIKGGKSHQEVSESAVVRAEVASERAIIKDEAIQPAVEPQQEQEIAQDKPESVTLWDSLVVKKGKAGDHDKPKKKHHGSSAEDKPDDSNLG